MSLVFAFWLVTFRYSLYVVGEIGNEVFPSGVPDILSINNLLLKIYILKSFLIK